MASKSLYLKYLQIISRWPIDASKEKRDISLHIRSRIGVLFPKGELSQLSTEQLSRANAEIEALERIINNISKNQYITFSDKYVSATGIGKENLNKVSSTKFIDEFNQFQELGVFKRWIIQTLSKFN